MNKDMVLKKVITILSKQLHADAEKINEDTSIADDLGADSLDTAEIAMMVKDEFDYDLTDDQIASIKTVKDIVDFLDSANTFSK